jgi:hypothetical protein
VNLGDWICEQRAEYHRKQLRDCMSGRDVVNGYYISQARIDRLDANGMNWNSSSEKD